ncbi:hypothetical protein ACFYZ9_31415 [Streptomyces sp. NPDC001691]|uniref:hypothetical protein n=1 Tax=Streptomyces sp. NPDC001691 TaxID=3364600 RepID=UPI0036747381
METTADDVLLQFCRSPRTHNEYRQWEQDSRRREVVPVVRGHVVRVVYEATSADVERICRRTEHALGEVRRKDGEAVRSIVDWHPDFAFTQMFHICMERLGAPPTYQDFRNFAENDRLGNCMISTPARAKVSEVIRSGVPESLAKDAMRWRIGNAYYSFLREIYSVVELRKRGVPLQMHPLADALFRVDAWTRQVALSLRVKNEKFREGQRGRKRPAADLLADLRPPIEFTDVELQPAAVYGRVHLPTQEQLDETAVALLSRE